MKTMEKLIARFNRDNPGYTAELDWLDSYEGWYTVCIYDDACGTSGRYHFRTCDEFAEWMNGVVLD